MVLVLTKNHVNERGEYLKLAKKFVAEAQCDPGCISMEIAINDEEPDTVLFISKWEEKTDFECHCSGSTFAKHIPKLSKYYVSGTDSFFELL